MFEKLTFDEEKGWMANGQEVPVGKWMGQSAANKALRGRAVAEAIEREVMPAVNRLDRLLGVPGDEAVNSSFLFFDDMVGGISDFPCHWAFRDAKERAYAAARDVRRNLQMMMLIVKSQLALWEKVM